MKKHTFFICFCIILIFAALCVTAVAESENEVYIDELGMSITIPESFDVFTRETDIEDLILYQSETSPEDIAACLSSNGYLYAVSDISDPLFGFSEIIVGKTSDYEGTIIKANLLDDYTLDLLAKFTVKQVFEPQGAKVAKYEIYRNSQNVFIEFHCKLPYVEATAINYITTYNGNVIGINFCSYSDEDTDSYKAQTREIVDQIVFDGSDKPKVSLPHIYTDEKFGTSFVVPANWALGETTVGIEKTETFFTVDTSFITTISYTCIDLVESAPPSEREEYIEMLAELESDHEFMYSMLRAGGCEEGSICQNTYSGVEYYRGTISSNDYGLDFESTVLLRIQDGLCHYFMLSGNHEYFKDFISLIQSVRYATDDEDTDDEDNTEIVTTSEKVSEDMPEKEGRDIEFGKIVLVCVGPVCCGVFIFIAVNVIKRVIKKDE